MEIRERVVDGVVILDLAGRFVLDEGERPFREHVNAAMHRGVRQVLVNFEDVTYLDSAGVGTLVWKFVTLRKHGGVMKLMNLRPRSHNVLLVTKLLDIFEAFESEAEALRSFAAVG